MKLKATLIAGFSAAAILALSFPGAAQNLYNTVEREAIKLSTIDSTPIGQSVPAAGTFTTVTSPTLRTNLLTGSGAGGFVNLTASDSTSAYALAVQDYARTKNFLLIDKVGYTTFNAPVVFNGGNSVYIQEPLGVGGLTTLNGIQNYGTADFGAGTVQNINQLSINAGSANLFNSPHVSTNLLTGYGAATFPVTQPVDASAPYAFAAQYYSSGSIANALTIDKNGLSQFNRPVSFAGSVSVGGTLSATGVVSAATFTGPLTGNVTGSVAGNSSTASALASTPSNCGTNSASGIQANGNAVCNANPGSLSFPNGYQQLPSGLILEWGTTPVFDTGPVTIGLPYSCPRQLANVQLTNNRDASGGMRVWGVANLTTSSFSAYNDGNGGAYWTAVCY